MDWQRSWITRCLPLALWTCLASCGGGGGPRSPGPPNVDQRGHAGILEYILDDPELLQIGDLIGVICVGLGEDGSQIPSLQFFEGFVGREPPVRASTACQRSTDPDDPYPVIQTAGGDQGLLIFLGDLDSSSRTVDVRIERTGAEPRILRCGVDLVFGVRRKVVLSEAPRPSATRSMQWTDWPIHVQGCEFRSQESMDW